MWRYLARRTLLTIPTLIAISGLIFILGKAAPGDPVENTFGEPPPQLRDPDQISEYYREKSAWLGISRPTFYWSLRPPFLPDTFHRVYAPERRARLRSLAAQTGDWPLVGAHEQSALAFWRAARDLPDSIAQKKILEARAYDLLGLTTTAELVRAVAELKPFLADFEAKGPFWAKFQSLETRTAALAHRAASPPFPWPVLHWNGSDNQYHAWVSGFLTGQWGRSKDEKDIWAEEIKPNLYPTLGLSGLAILLAYLLAVPLGMEMARRRDRAFDRWAKRGLLLVYAMPVFWAAGLAILVFATRGQGLSLIDNPYLDVTTRWQPTQQPFWQWFFEKLPRFVLPMAVLTLHTMVVVTLQMRSGIVAAMGQDYIRTARAKGLPEEEVYWQHALRNALIPLIATLASVFPAVFAGSLVVEQLFQFPGMGTKTFAAFMAHDHWLLLAILLLGTFLTVLVNLLADVLKVWADPRVRLAK
jgi:peptide/nickel transport system permease protein